MKINIFMILGLVSTVFFTSAVAQVSPDPCGGSLPQITIDADLQTLLNGNTICTSDSQEQHRAGNELWDYKKGAGDPVDPTSLVGGWSVSGGKVNYTYGASTFANDVYASGSNVCFYNGATAITATIMSGISGPCPGF